MSSRRIVSAVTFPADVRAAGAQRQRDGSRHKAETTTELLAITGLAVTYNETNAVSGVSFSVGPGEFYGIVGESGSGKSATARAIIGMVKDPGNVTGSIRLNGKELIGQDEKHWQTVRGSKIGLVYQDATAALDPVYTVGRQLVEVARATHPGMSKREARKIAVSALDEVGIPEPAKRFSSYPHEFSGGMRQRVAIALAVIGDPKLLIADEPTSALDVVIQQQVLTLLRHVARERGTAVILITHDLAVVAQMCTRVAVFYGGLIVEEATPEELFREPIHPYSAALLQSLPAVGEKKAITAIPGSPPHITGGLHSCPFHPRCSRVTQECRVSVPAISWRGSRMYRCFNSMESPA